MNPEQIAELYTFAQQPLRHYLGGLWSFPEIVEHVNFQAQNMVHGMDQDITAEDFTKLLEYHAKNKMVSDQTT